MPVILPDTVLLWTFGQLQIIPKQQIQKDGKLITNTSDKIEQDLFVNSGLVKEEDVPSGWIYTLQTKSTHPELSSIKDLYKIGFSSTPVLERIKNAKNEATYLFSDVKNLKALLNLSINNIDTKGKLFFELKNSNLAKSVDLDFFLNLKNILNCPKRRPHPL